MGMIGERILRTEDPDLVTGRGTFIDNLDLPGAGHVVYVRSSVAHARITNIDTSTAAQMPGVFGVFTSADLQADGLNFVPIDMPLLPAGIRRSALADGTVRYVGELIAVVVAESRAQAVDAAELSFRPAREIPGRQRGRRAS